MARTRSIGGASSRCVASIGAIVERKARDLLAQVDADRDLSTSLALDAVAAGA
jgi:hypothetical protein